MSDAHPIPCSCEYHFKHRDGCYCSKCNKGITSLQFNGSIISYTCSHPNLVPTAWEQKKPEPCAMIIGCCENNVTCPVCGYGWGQAPCCGAPEIEIVLDRGDCISRGTGEYCPGTMEIVIDNSNDASCSVPVGPF